MPVRFPVDKTMNKILNKLEEDFEGQASREQIKEVIYLLFRNTNDMMSNDSLPRVMIPKLGDFYLKEKKVERIVNKTGFFKEALERHREEKIRLRNGRNRKNRNNDSERSDTLDSGTERGDGEA